MKLRLHCLLLCSLLLPLLCHGQTKEAVSGENRTPVKHFLTEGQWYNFYFTKENNPLYRGNVSINAVKVTGIGTDSWVEIMFPPDYEQHAAMIGARAEDKKASGKATVDGAAFQKWEKSVSDWQKMWVNLGYVVRITAIDDQVAQKENSERRN